MENMNVTPEADTKASKKSSKMKVVFAVIVVLVLVLGGAYYLVFSQPASTPPTLTGGDQSTYQGMIQKDISISGVDEQFLGFDGNDVTEWDTVTKVALDAAGKTPLEFEVTAENEGIAAVYSDEDVTFLDAFRMIDPTDPNDPTAPNTAAVAIAYYDTATGKFLITENSYYVNPQIVTQILLFDSAGNVDEVEMDSHIIPAGQLFYVIISEDADIYLNGADIAPASSTDFCTYSYEGWYNGVLINFSDLDCMEHIEALWLMDNTGEYVEITDIITKTRDYYSDNYAVWIEFDVAPNTPTTAVPVEECTDAEGNDPLITDTDGCGEDNMCLTGYVESTTTPGTCEAVVVEECTDVEGNDPLITDTDGCGEDNMCLTGYIESTTTPGTCEAVVVTECDEGEDHCTAGTCDTDYTPVGDGTCEDITAPDTITDLDATADTVDASIELTWTAPADASVYDLRYALISIDVNNWDNSTLVTPITTGVPIPPATGSMTIDSLSYDTTYYYAIKTTDGASNTSLISNVASATTPVAPAVCGNGIQEAGEECDGNDFRYGNLCATYNPTYTGTVTCSGCHVLTGTCSVVPNGGGDPAVLMDPYDPYFPEIPQVIPDWWGPGDPYDLGGGLGL